MYCNIVPLILATDENYIFPTAVTIASILKNAYETTFYDIYILIADGYQECCEELIDFLKHSYKNFNISYIKIDNEMFKNVNVTNPHVRVPTYYRLLSAKILNQYNKCICLDSDIMVNEDLSEVFYIEMENNYIAGVKSWDDQQPTELNRQHMLDDKLPSMGQYIYMGFLIMNLEKIRQDNMTEIFLDYMNNGYRSDDQDVFNICCYNKIIFLPVKFNLLVRFYNLSLPEGNSIYSEKELQDAWRAPVVLHYPGRLMKPWLNLRVKESERWWKYAGIFCKSALYQCFYKKRNMLSEGNDWSSFLNKLLRGKQYILFGYSEIGKRLCDDLIKNGIEVIGFCDNDERKQTYTYNEMPVFSLEQLANLEFDFAVIVTSQLYYKEISTQLEEHGIAAYNVIEFVNKSKVYYRSLDRRYYGVELREIYIREFGNSQYFDELGYDNIIDELKRKRRNPDTEQFINKYWMDEWLF